MLIQGGNTGGFTHSGSIPLNEDPFAWAPDNGGGRWSRPVLRTRSYGKTGGVRLVGPSPFVRRHHLQRPGSASRQRFQGYSIEARAAGLLVVGGGSVSVVGDRNVGVNVAAPVSSAVRVTGPVTVTGMGSTAIDIPSGDVGGFADFIYSTVTATGWHDPAGRPRSTSSTRCRRRPPGSSRAAWPVHVGASASAAACPRAAPPPGAPPPTSSGDADPATAWWDSAVGLKRAVASFGSAARRADRHAAGQDGGPRPSSARRQRLWRGGARRGLGLRRL